MFVNLDYSLKNFPKGTFYESEIIEINERAAIPPMEEEFNLCLCVCERRKKQTENQ